MSSGLACAIVYSLTFFCSLCVSCAQPGLAGITSMLVGKAHRHEATWQQYCASRDTARQQHDTAAAAAAAVLKATLDGVSYDIEQQMSVLAEDKVMLLSEQQILQVRLEGTVL